MIFVAEDDQQRALLARFVAERIPEVEGVAPPFEAVGVWRDGVLNAVALYHDFRGRVGVNGQCEITFAAESPRWASKQTVAFILWYGLIHLNCRRMTAITRDDNEAVHKLLAGVGFRKEGRHLDMFGDRAGISWGITQRWYLKAPRYGKTITALAA